MSKELLLSTIPPRENQVLQGHLEAENTFFEEFKSRRMHHAWLIYGPEGIGKATLAYRIARYVLSQRSEGLGSLMMDAGALENVPGKNNSLDNSCLFIPDDDPVFRKVANGTHPDLYVLERGEDQKSKKKRKAILASEARTVGEFLSKTPGNGHWRVVIIDAVDEMNLNASNALLKIIEAPPKYALVLLVCHNFGEVPSTVRSRCRLLRLKQLPSNKISKLMSQNFPDVKENELQQIMSIANGSVGVAARFLADGDLEVFRLANTLLADLAELDAECLIYLGDKIDKDKTGSSLLSLNILLDYWLTNFIKNHSSDSARSNLELAHWLEIWEEMNHLFGKCESVNLDSRQVIYSIFHKMSSRVKGYS